MKKYFLILLFFIALCCAACLAGCNVLSADHQHNFDEWVITKRATCEGDGERERYCSCGQKQVGKLASLGHDLTVFPEREATCTQSGVTEHVTCSRCDYATEYEEIPALGHDILEYNKKSPTCKVAGYEAYEKCSRCDYSTFQEIQPLGCEFGEWTTVTAATCFVTGEEVRICSRDDSHFESRTIDKLNHIPAEEWTVTIEAACEVEGEKVKICTLCESVLEIQSVPALEHDFGEWEQKTEASCTADGVRVQVCSHDSKHINEDITPALGHKPISSYDDDKHFETCERCGELITSSPHVWNDNDCACGYDAGGIKGFEWLLADGSYQLKSIGSVAETSIQIPSTHNGKPVTSIAPYAFRNCKDITEIVVHISITTMGFAAFTGCNSLTEITLPYIGSSADSEEYSHFSSVFGASSKDKTKDYMPETLKTVNIVGEITAITDEAFYNCADITTVNLPDTIETIGEEAFNGCLALKNITLPQSLKTIARAAFYNCPNLESLEIPESTEYIGEYAFCGCEHLNTVAFTLIDNWAFYKNEEKQSDIPSTTMQNAEDAAEYLKNSFYYIYVWKRG